MTIRVQHSFLPEQAERIPEHGIAMHAYEEIEQALTFIKEYLTKEISHGLEGIACMEIWVNPLPLKSKS